MCDQLHAPAAVPRRERVPGNHTIGGYLGPFSGQDALEEGSLLVLPGTEPRFLSRTFRSVVTISTELSRLTL